MLQYFRLPVALLFLVSTLQTQAQVKILFDATKGEMAGNADWVIDYDVANVGVGSTGTYTVSATNRQSNPQRIPTPAQSGITSSTPETYWTGGISAWGVDCAKRGYTVETLPWNGSITYGNSSNAQDLSNYTIFVIDEPNIRMSSAEKAAIINFVNAGGSLFIIADHESSDRNGDGWDSRMVLNDLIRNNGVDAYPFGLIFDSVDISQTTTNVVGTATDSIVHGPVGNVNKVQWSGGTTMTLSTADNATVKGVVFKTGTTPGTTNVMVAYCRYGRGKVVAMGDSSPSDDGTGNPNCTLYTGYTGDASGNHQLLIMNATIWLAYTGTTEVLEPTNKSIQLKVFPNPSTGIVNIGSSLLTGDVRVEVVDMMGKLAGAGVLTPTANNLYMELNEGLYLVRAINGSEVTTTKALIVK
ncbi:MAG: T9SS C-terminal target domain-containing protein [Chitinophagia bacterium]|nr:T9SS C-terminal target domain-containing protein [Chitinophagia bacterium]